MNFKDFILLVAALFCFAGNSLLCRAALGPKLIGPEEFTFVRLASGAFVLTLLTFLRSAKSLSTVGSWNSSLALFAYAILFSFAYLRLDAGVGALILFGCVQTTMIGWSVWQRRMPRRQEWLGLSAAGVGLVVLTLPGKSAPDLMGFLLMCAAGISWGIYSVRGAKGGSPLTVTAMNFLRAIPLALLFWWFSQLKWQGTNEAYLLAVASGALTSGLGYAAWYAVVPKLGANKAAIVQMAVPVLALLLSSLFLGERWTLRLILASLLILMGVALALTSPANKPHHFSENAQ